MIEVSLKNPIARMVVLLVSAGASSLLGYLVVSQFVVGVFADERTAVTESRLAEAVEHYPDSARLHSRLAESLLLGDDADLSEAQLHANRAAELSPSDVNLQLLLASILEVRGDTKGAEQSIRIAVKGAPTNFHAHWRLANLLLREGRIDESLPEFRQAAALNPDLLRSTLDLVWRASGGNAQATEAAVSTRPADRLALARFLLQRERAAEAVNIFKTIAVADALSLGNGAAFIDELIAHRQLNVAYETWLSLVEPAHSHRETIWNGGFESSPPRGLAQFDWTIGRTQFARMVIDRRNMHGGSRSLRIDFLGLDTTRLESEISHLLVVQPGVRYRLQCYVKTERLVTPEGPRIVITDVKGTSWLAAGDPVQPGSSDWRDYSIEFVAPQTESAAAGLLVSIKRKPRFSYDDPTEGTVWFDDFTLVEQQPSGVTPIK